MCENCDRKYNMTVCDLHVVRHSNAKSAVTDPTMEHHSILLPLMLSWSTMWISQTNVYFLLIKLKLFQTPFKLINLIIVNQMTCASQLHISIRTQDFAHQCATELMDSDQNVLYLFTMIPEYKPVPQLGQYQSQASILTNSLSQPEICNTFSARLLLLF